ncbi:hypothetical protein NC652_004303 [Populus alba x Populus x berolinensis]|uniref:Uncharacterized protein n=1 Tax=Populus alba x Populus x berolinensis TaxID=444605 RepID=A0AAD6RTN7_9ROSI|nr:hypothetical protein NC652_004303 [Populus alba x Populus x berolinensis]KAJ7014956.1 hypothetical protein NC653_004296 [Populus alba x Populus x berolinensis]
MLVCCFLTGCCYITCHYIQKLKIIAVLIYIYIKKNRERRETMERLKTDMVEIGEGQKRIREGQREIRQKFEEIESECRSLKEETMNIAKQSDYNQIRINLMFSILKAREDNNFAHADHLTGLLREEMEKQEQGKPGLVG